MTDRVQAWARWQLPYIAFCYAYFPVTLTKRVIFRQKRAYIGLDPIVRRFWDKWGSPPVPPAIASGKPIWINMNSGGEVMMSSGLLRRLEAAREDIILSTESYDSFEMLSRQNEPGRVFFPPWDTLLPVTRSLARVNPRALVFVQNAYFPVLLRYARRAGAKTILVNGLLSRNMDRGNPTMDRATGLRFYCELDAISVQTEVDAEAFRRLGVSPGRISVTGDLSGDLDGVALSDAERAGLRSALGFGDEPLLIVGSTHPGERHAIVSALTACRRRLPKMRFIVAPRQLHEAWYFVDACRAAGFRTVRRTDLDKEPIANPDVLVLDTFGELRRLYGIADVAFIGSSLVPLNERGGGHNPLEPLAHGTVPLFGPYMSLWHEAVRALRDAWPEIEVKTSDDVANGAEAVVTGRAPARQVQAVGSQLLAASAGAVEMTAAFLTRELGDLWPGFSTVHG